MNDTINLMMSLDKACTERIEHAKEEAARIIEDAKAEEARLLRESRRSIRMQEKGDRRRENKLTGEKLAAIEALKNEKIAALEEEFAVNSDKWAEELFKRITAE